MEPNQTGGAGAPPAQAPGASPNQQAPAAPAQPAKLDLKGGIFTPPPRPMPQVQGASPQHINAALARHQQQQQAYEKLTQMQSGIRNQFENPTEIHGYKPSYTQESVKGFQDFLAENRGGLSHEQYFKLYHMNDVIEHNRKAAVQEYLAQQGQSPQARANMSPAVPPGGASPNVPQPQAAVPQANPDRVPSTAEILQQRDPAMYQKLVTGQMTLDQALGE